MANEEHLAILKQGVEVWNRWREENGEIKPDLHGAHFSGANLYNADLHGVNFNKINLSMAKILDADLRIADLIDADLSLADLSRADLSWANLSRAELIRTNFINANLSRAFLIRADLRGADLRKADLNRANLSEANLSNANLSNANLSNANLSNANLSNTNLHMSNLSSTNFTEAKLGGTLLGNTDLSQAVGLDAVHHRGPSTIGLDTIYRSQGKIPEPFLLGTGVPADFVAYIDSFIADKSIDFYSCFISFSVRDRSFAERLYSRLQSKGVRCWYAPEDMKIGSKIRQTINEAIRVRDKLLVVLSEHSLASAWVEDEVEAAFEEEYRRQKTVLFPVRLDDTVMESNKGWASKLRQRHIGNFRQWKHHDEYEAAFERLLRDLRAEEDRN